MSARYWIVGLLMLVLVSSALTGCSPPAAKKRSGSTTTGNK